MKKILLGVSICIIVIMIFSFYEYMISASRFVEPEVINIINTKSNEYIKSISGSNELYSDDETYSFLLSLKGKKLNFEAESDNEGAKDIYVYGVKVNQRPIGVYMIKEGNLFMPKWKVIKISLL